MATTIVLLFIGLFIVGFTLDGVLRRSLRRRHPEVWRSLGSPTLVMNNSISNGLRLERFLWASEYKALSDPALNRLALTIKVVFVVYTIVFVSVIAIQL